MEPIATEAAWEPGINPACVGPISSAPYTAAIERTALQWGLRWWLIAVLTSRPSAPWRGDRSTEPWVLVG